MGLAAYFRLARAGYVLAREGAFSIIDPEIVPPALKPAIGLARLIERPSVRRSGKVERLTRALNRLGPTYVKFGQTLATRPDIVGPEIAADLAALQDKMEPFDAALVPAILEEALKEHAVELLELSPPVAATHVTSARSTPPAASTARMRCSSGRPPLGTVQRRSSSPARATASVLLAPKSIATRMLVSFSAVLDAALSGCCALS